MNQIKRAEIILRELGITQPDEIDLEAIAWHVGAKVRYRPLDGCEARILGNATQAIITVNSKSSPRRQRFSIGHELGHWGCHRGKLLICSSNDIGKVTNDDVLNPERVADKYAADLLMPDHIFRPLARNYPKLSFKIINELAELFNVSKTAIAIRLVEGGHFTALVVCHGPAGRKWFFRSPDVPSRWFPQDNLDPESFAYDILFKNTSEDTMPRKIGADGWFNLQEAQRYEIFEQTIRTGDQEIITILLIEDDRMLQELNYKFNRRY